MIPEAYLIASTNVDWIKFLKESNIALTRSLTSSLDKQQLEATGLPAFLCTIQELLKPGYDPIRALRYESHLLKHVMLSFFVTTTAESIYQIMQITDLAIAGHGSAIISGSLKAWQDAVITCAKESTSFETRLLFDKIYILLDRQGLSEIFAAWSKRKLTDQTFVLEPKE